MHYLNLKDIFIKNFHIQKDEYPMHMMIDQLHAVLADKTYATPASFIQAPFDQDRIEMIKKDAQEISTKDIDVILLIGIGGSSLGAQALYYAMLEKNHKKIIFLDTVDPLCVSAMYQTIKKYFQEGKKVFLLLISKSGTTFEIINNAAIFINLAHLYYKDNLNQYIAVATDYHSPLHQEAKKQGWYCFEIPQQVGGRFSVFTVAGILPLILADINIDLILQGARDITYSCLSAQIEENHAAHIAQILHYQYKNNILVHNFFMESIYFEHLGNWCRQLFAESLGKQSKGLLPIVSIATQDLHSMLQFYLAGPHMITTSFLKIKHYAYDMEIPIIPALRDMLAIVIPKKNEEIFKRIMHCVRESFKDAQKPYYSIEMPEFSYYYLGQYMQLYMIITIYLGKLLHINPFDQPEIEHYKQKAREILYS